MSTPPPGFRVTNVPLPPHLQAHIDNQARRLGISKAGFLRMLIVRDLEAEHLGTRAKKG